MEGHLFKKTTRNDDQDGLWEHSEEYEVCVGGKTHVKYLSKKDTVHPGVVTSVVYTKKCDGTCRAHLPLPMVAMQAVEEFLAKS